MQLKIKKLHPDAIIPKYQTDGAACFDLHALAEAGMLGEDLGLPVEFMGGFTIRTGLSFEVQLGFALMVYSRSSQGFQKDTRLANCVGVIDSDYRGEVLVRLFNDGAEPYVVKRGDRIAQAMLVQVPRVELVEVDELSDTARGAGGFGSTGA